MTDLIKRDDALAACDIAPPDEWNDYTKGGYDFAAEECKRNIAALPAVTVGVKPLVWEGFISGSYRIEVSDTGIADLWCYSAEMFEDEIPFLMMGGYLNLVSIDDLKAVAQADYEARVLSALTPIPVADRQPAATREAALQARIEELERQFSVYARSERLLVEEIKELEAKLTKTMVPLPTMEGWDD